MKAKSWYLAKYLLLGLLCGVVATVKGDDSILSFPLPSPWFFLPAVLLGAVISIAGRYISGLQFRHGWFSPVILIVACSIGWYAAQYLYIVTLAYVLFEQSPFFVPLVITPAAGGVGALAVAIGLVLAWRLSRHGFVIAVVTLAGILGPVVMSLGTAVDLFIAWHGILFLGIGIAIPVNSDRNNRIGT